MEAWELDRNLTLVADHARPGCPLEQVTVLATKEVLICLGHAGPYVRGTWSLSQREHGPPSLRESRNSVSGCCWKIFLHWLLGLHCTSYAQGWTPSFHFETTLYDSISPFHCGHPLLRCLISRTLKELTFATTSKQLFQLTHRNNADSHRLFVRSVFMQSESFWLPLSCLERECWQGWTLPQPCAPENNYS